MAAKPKYKALVKLMKVRKAPVRRKRVAVKVVPVLSYGERAVGLTFNPSGDPTVLKLKKLYAEIIDILAEGNKPTKFSDDIRATAIFEAMSAQMWAVKSATWHS